MACVSVQSMLAIFEPGRSWRFESFDKCNDTAGNDSRICWLSRAQDDVLATEVDIVMICVGTHNDFCTTGSSIDCCLRGNGSMTPFSLEWAKHKNSYT